MSRTLESLRVPAIVLLVVTGTAFLLKMCYMPFALCTLLGAAWLAAVYFYARRFHGVALPLALLTLVFAAVEVDALGILVGALAAYFVLRREPGVRLRERSA